MINKEKLTWKDIKLIVQIADWMIGGDTVEQLHETNETEAYYYEAILTEFNKRRKCPKHKKGR